MRTAILTISSSLASGEGEDLSGPALADAATDAGCDVELREVLADDQAAIESRLRELVAEGFDVILTSGGTGLTPDDVTPEASEAVIERPVRRHLSGDFFRKGFFLGGRRRRPGQDATAQGDGKQDQTRLPGCRT